MVAEVEDGVLAGIRVITGAGDSKRDELSKARPCCQGYVKIVIYHRS